jgi:hypothetical protein
LYTPAETIHADLRSDVLAGETVVAYHERTKHHYHRHAAAPDYLDWATQPDPFRRYQERR